MYVYVYDVVLLMSSWLKFGPLPLTLMVLYFPGIYMELTNPLSEVGLISA